MNINVFFLVIDIILIGIGIYLIARGIYLRDKLKIFIGFLAITVGIIYTFNIIRFPNL